MDKLIKKTITVEGMMCSNCEKHVQEALEKIEGVKSAVANHKKSKVTVKLSPSVPENLLEQAVTEAGYRYSSEK